jgi:hypothetical protein
MDLRDVLSWKGVGEDSVDKDLMRLGRKPLRSCSCCLRQPGSSIIRPKIYLNFFFSEIFTS